MIRTITLAAGLIASGVLASQAGELAPLAANAIALNGVAGAAYYTVEPDGYRVVTTLQAGENGSAMRFVATLSDGQKLLLSVPDGAGIVSSDIEIERTGETVTITGKPDLRAAVALD